MAATPKPLRREMKRANKGGIGVFRAYVNKYKGKRPVPTKQRKRHVRKMRRFVKGLSQRWFWVGQAACFTDMRDGRRHG